LQDFEGDDDVLRVSGVKGGLDRNDQLRDDRKHLSSTLIKHIKHTLHGQESVGVHLLSDSLEEDWEVMMVVKLLDLDLPVNFVWGTVLDGDWKISSIVEKTELRNWNPSFISGSSSRLLSRWVRFGKIGTEGLASGSITFLCESGATGGNRNLLVVHRLDWVYSFFLSLHIFLREITEYGMLGSWKVIVPVGFPTIALSDGKALLKVIFQDILGRWSYTN